MAIEFPCTGCGNQLSVPDEAVGKRARCPKCQTVVSVPDQSPAADAGTDDEFRLKPLDNPPSAPSQSPASDPAGFPAGAAAGFSSSDPPQKPTYSDNPYASPSLGYDDPYVKKAAPGTITPTPIDFGDVFSHAWNLYMQNVGIVLGAVMLAYVINLIIGWVLGFIVGVLLGIVGEGDPAAAAVLNLVMQLFLNLVQVAIATFFNIGVWRIVLDVGKGQRQDFGRFFSGGDIYLPMFGAVLLWLLMVVPATFLLILPGIAVLIVFGQFHFLMIDQRLGVIESFSKSIEITNPNWLPLLGIYTVCLLIAIACCITCIPVALIFFGPYISMVFAVMYLKMTGQEVARA